MNIKIIFPILLLAFISTHTFSQELSAELKWSQLSETSGRGSAIFWTKILTDNMGSACVCGQKSIFNGVDLGLYAIKYDSTGNQLWQNVYNTLALDLLWDCELDIDGNLILAGTTSYFNEVASITVVKYSPDGEELWVFEHFDPMAFSASVRDVFSDDEGNIYLVGSELIDDEADYLTLFKLSPSGEIIWKNRYEQQWTYGRYGKLLEDRIVVLGLSIGNGAKYVIHQVSFEGETIATIENIKEDNYFKYVTFDNNGNLYLGDEARQYKVAKISLEGDTSWYYELPLENPPGNEVFARLTALKVDGDENAYVTGPYYEEESGFGVVTTKLNSNGEKLWSQRYSHLGQETADSPNDIAITDEYVFVIGDTYINSETGRDYLLLVYSTEGEELLALSYDNNGNLYDAASSVAVNGNNIYLTGLTNISGSGFDSTYILTQRYKIDVLVSAISQERIVAGVEIYPNPFVQNIHIKQTGSDYFFEEYGLYSVSGELLANGIIQSKESQVKLPASLPFGIYLLKMKPADGEEMRKLLIKRGD